MAIIEFDKVYRVYEYKTGYFRKSKNIKIALNNVSFSVNEGEIFGLLGENGAGKTTTIKILSTLLLPTSGTCKILNLDVATEEKKIRNHINFIFGGETGLYPRLSGKDNLKYFANLYNIDHKIVKSRIDELLSLVDMSDAAEALVETYSKGMIQRMQIAKGLINDPQILLMDEPTIGLDPIGAKILRDIILKLKKRGKTVIITTHYMFEADCLCDRVAFLKNGKIIDINTPDNFKEKLSDKYQIEVVLQYGVEVDTTLLKKMRGVYNVSFNDNIIIIDYDKKNETLNSIFNYVKHFPIKSFSKKNMQLEDVYINLLGE